MYSRGEPVKITIDDRIPTFGYDNQPYWAGFGSHGSIWGMLIEKAYAKMNVNYSRIIGGFSIQAFRDLTGMPVAHFYSSKQNDEEFYKNINNAQEKDWLMGVSCCK